MRDRLIELIQSKSCDSIAYTECMKKTSADCEEICRRIPIELEDCEKLADHLLANGVIVPPCKVGDLLYMPWEYDGNSGVALLSVTYMVIDKAELRIMTDFSTDDDVYYDLYFGGRFVPSDFGKTVFLTREEAERKLKEGKG